MQMENVIAALVQCVAKSKEEADALIEFGGINICLSEEGVYAAKPILTDWTYEQAPIRMMIDGPSYMHLGPELGGQQEAIVFIAVMAHLGLGKKFSPYEMGLGKDEESLAQAESLIGSGLLYLIEYKYTDVDKLATRMRTELDERPDDWYIPEHVDRELTPLHIAEALCGAYDSAFEECGITSEFMASLIRCLALNSEAAPVPQESIDLVKNVGQKIHELGGLPLMRTAEQHLWLKSRASETWPQNMRMLNRLWDGVGDWTK